MHHRSPPAATGFPAVFLLQGPFAGQGSYKSEVLQNAQEKLANDKPERRNDGEDRNASLNGKTITRK